VEQRLESFGLIGGNASCCPDRVEARVSGLPLAAHCFTSLTTFWPWSLFLSSWLPTRLSAGRRTEEPLNGVSAAPLSLHRCQMFRLSPC